MSSENKSRLLQVAFALAPQKRPKVFSTGRSRQVMNRYLDNLWLFQEGWKSRHHDWDQLSSFAARICVNRLGQISRGRRSRKSVMHLRNWLAYGIMALPSLSCSRTIREADLLGGWRITEARFTDDSLGREAQQAAAGISGWVVLWPDHLWGYGGILMGHHHGGARWRLVGDTLWLGNDYWPYFHPMIEPRVDTIMAKGHGFGIVDMNVIRKGASFAVPDAVYWAQAFRDTVGNGQAGTWVYKVSRKDQRTLSLVRIDALSRATGTVATTMMLTRDSLNGCKPIPGPRYYTGLWQGSAEARKAWENLWLNGCR